MSGRFLSIQEEKTTDIDRAILIANFYYTTPYLGYESFKNYLKEIHVDIYDLSSYVHHLTEEMDFILDIHDDLNYQYQVEHLHKIVPQKVESVIERDYVDETLNVTTEFIEENVQEVKDHLIETTVVAYKYQLKYCLMALLQIINDRELWSETEILSVTY